MIQSATSEWGLVIVAIINFTIAMGLQGYFLDASAMDYLSTSAATINLILQTISARGRPKHALDYLLWIFMAANFFHLVRDLNTDRPYYVKWINVWVSMNKYMGFSLFWFIDPKRQSVSERRVSQSRVAHHQRMLIIIFFLGCCSILLPLIKSRYYPNWSPNDPGPPSRGAVAQACAENGLHCQYVVEWLDDGVWNTRDTAPFEFHPPPKV